MGFIFGILKAVFILLPQWRYIVWSPLVGTHVGGCAGFERFSGEFIILESL
jgi:hypothetical protein